MNIPGMKESSSNVRKTFGWFVGKFSGCMNIQDRLVCQMLESDKTVKVIRIWTHLKLMRFDIILYIPEEQ